MHFTAFSRCECAFNYSNFTHEIQLEMEKEENAAAEQKERKIEWKSAPKRKAAMNGEHGKGARRPTESLCERARKGIRLINKRKRKSFQYARLFASYLFGTKGKKTRLKKKRKKAASFNAAKSRENNRATANIWKRTLSLERIREEIGIECGRVSFESVLSGRFFLCWAMLIGKENLRWDYFCAKVFRRLWLCWNDWRNTLVCSFWYTSINFFPAKRFQ